MPNMLAYAALLLWPIVSFALFRSLGPARGLIASLIGGYLLLPPVQAGFDLPLLPPLNKESIPSYAALAICLALYRPGLRLLPEGRVARVLLGMYLVGPVLTIASNTDPVVWGPVALPALRLLEAPSIVLNQLALVTPFLLARALLSGVEDQRRLLWGLVIGTLAYSLPMLVEVRLSPQLNTWIYGFFQHSFEQMMRGGGFRPIVFLYHGLWVALLAATAVLAACVLLRSAEAARRKATLAFIALWLLMVLILCKSLGSLVFTFLFGPLILLASVRMQVRLAGIVAVMALAYPIARGADLVPVQALVQLAGQASPDRAQSLGFRFDNEAVLLDRARERQVFGWGIWGRHLVHDRSSGRIITIADGRWIIVLGVLGWTGFLAEFGLLTLPLLVIWWRGGPAPPRITAGLMVLLAVNLVDLFPNATLTSMTWLFAGALLGWAERPEARTAPAAVAAPSFPVLLGGPSGLPVRTVL